MPPIDWEMISKVSGAAIALGGLILGVRKWRWERRPDRFDWEIDGDYVIDIANDRARFPQIFAQQNPVEGDTGIMVRVTFRGRSSITITGLRFEWNDVHNFGGVPVTRCTLNDGQTWEQLIFTREYAMEQITGVVIQAEGGRTYRYEINPEYRHRYRAHTGRENP